MVRKALVVGLLAASVVGRVAGQDAAGRLAGQDAAGAVGRTNTSGSSVASRGGVAASDPQAVLKQYCVTCHNERVKAAGLTLDTLNLADASAHAETWEKVIRKVRVGMMPPDGAAKPDAATRRTFVSALEATLDRAAAARPNPGRPMIHRLNRAEYTYAIRDLLDLEIDPVTLLPPDESGYGFDTSRIKWVNAFR